MVREEFIRHAERQIQDQPAGSFDFRAESSPSPPPTPRHPQEPPRAEWVGCVTQFRDEVKAYAGVLLRSGGGFDMAGDAGGPSAFDFNEQVHRAQIY